MKIKIEEYNPKWQDQFNEESHKLISILSGFKPTIEHIGSTSIKGLGAKPIIDILIGLPNFEEATEAVELIKTMQYQYVQEFESSMPNRRFFYKMEGTEKSHHIHMVQLESDFWKRHIAFRDNLRVNKKDFQDYYDLKLELSKLEWKDGNEYAAAKNTFIRAIEEKLPTSK